MTEKNLIIKSREKYDFTKQQLRSNSCLLDVCNSGEYFDMLEGWLEILCACPGHVAFRARIRRDFLRWLSRDTRRPRRMQRSFLFFDADSRVSCCAGISIEESRVGILRWHCESIALRPSRGPIEITFIFARGSRAIFSRSKRLYASPPRCVQFQLLRLLLARWLFIRSTPGSFSNVSSKFSSDFHYNWAEYLKHFAQIEIYNGSLSIGRYLIFVKALD